MQNIVIVNLFNGADGGVRITLHVANILAEREYKVRLVALSGLPIDTLDRIHGTNLAKYLWKNLYVKYLLDYQQSKYLLRFRLYVYQHYIKMLKEVIATYDPDIIVLYGEHWQGCGVICNMIVNRISKEVRNLLHEVYILFHGFGNVGNFAIFKGTFRVLRKVASGVDVPMIDPRAVPNTRWVSLYNTLNI